MLDWSFWTLMSAAIGGPILILILILLTPYDPELDDYDRWP